MTDEYRNSLVEDLYELEVNCNICIEELADDITEDCKKFYQQGRADSEIIRKVFSKMEQPNNCLFNNMSACCYPISDCMNCPITIDEMRGADK